MIRKRSKAPLIHKYHKCEKGCTGCRFCEHGILWCEICDAVEGQLLTYCPGRKLSVETLEACYSGKVKDFCVFLNAKLHGAKIIKGRVTWS